MKTFKEYLVTKRKKMEFTQEKLADYLGISRRTIENWENEVCSPWGKTLRLIQDKLASSSSEKKQIILAAARSKQVRLEKEVNGRQT